MVWRAIPGPLSKRKRRLDSLEAAQGAPSDRRRDSRGEQSPWLPPETVITFLPRSKRILISWPQTPSAVILEPPKIKSDTVSTLSLHDALPIWPKYWSFSFNISPSNEHPGLISFRMDWLDLLAVQGTLKSLL